MLILELTIVACLIVLNGFFAMSELAVVSSRRSRLQHLAETGRRGSAVALRLRDDPTGFLSTVQIGITLVGILAGAYSGATLAGPLADVLRNVPGLASVASNLALALVVVTITYLSLIAGELVPKRIALSNAEGIASSVARPMLFLAKAGAPVVWFLRLSTEAVLRVLGVAQRPDPIVTEEEVKSLIAEGTNAGVFEPAEREMIEGVLRIADRPARSIMVPRPNVVWLDVDGPPDAIYQQVLQSGHSRYPVCRRQVDEVIGVAHTKEMLDQLRRKGRLDLAEIVREPIYISESMPVLKLLDTFRTAPVHMAVALDEHGTFEGIVTPMDILTGIAGDLPEGEGEAAPDAVRRSDGSWLLDGGMPVHAVERVLATSGMAVDDYVTLAGFVLHHLAHLPEIGESFVWGDWHFEVVDMDGRRIDKVLVRRASA